MSHIVLLHGFTQTASVWKPYAGGLEALGHRVSVPNLPGHGNADPALDRLDMQQAATWLTNTYGAGIYVGYSMGGRIALHAALAYPNLVQHLVAIGTRVGIEGAAAQNARVKYEHSLATRIEDDFEGFIDEWLDAPVNARLDENAKQRALRLTNRPEGLAASLRHRGTGPALWPLRRMHATFLYGEFDLPGIASDAKRAAELTEGEAICVKNAGHSMPFEQPDVFLGILLQIIAATTRRLRT